MSGSSQGEMPFAFIFRVEDESKLWSVREHMTDRDGWIRENYDSRYEEYEDDGEALHIVTWEVSSS